MINEEMDLQSPAMMMVVTLQKNSVHACPCAHRTYTDTLTHAQPIKQNIKISTRQTTFGLPQGTSGDLA